MSDDEAEDFPCDLECPCSETDDFTDACDVVRKWFNSHIPDHYKLYVFKARPWRDGSRARGWKIYFYSGCCGNTPCPSNVSKATSHCKDGSRMFKLIRRFSPRGCFFEGFLKRDRLHFEFATKYVKCTQAQARNCAAKIVLEREGKPTIYLKRGDRIQRYWVVRVVTSCNRCRPS